MRFGHWRGATLAIAVLGALGMGSIAPTYAGGIFGIGHTIPRETLAQDYRTGGVYYAPPIPYGEYTKDYVGCMHAAAGLLHGGIGKLCGACFGKGCGLCGGLGCLHGDACGGKGCGLCGGRGLFGKHHGGGGDPCGSCGGRGCGLCGGGLGLGHGGGLGLGHGHGSGVVIGGHAGCGPLGCGSPGCGNVAATPQGLAVPAKVIASPQAGLPVAAPCGGCGGRGCGLCGGGLFGKHHGGGLGSNACGSCGGQGCGLCGGGLGLGLGHGGGLFGKHHGGAGVGDPCGACGGRGCGLCGGLGHGGGLHGLGVGSHVMGLGHGIANKLGVGGVKYFVGPGGPVPLTPGYVPWINPIRSPRDFFAFPPYVDRAF
jgi:hypothetical protein